MNSVVNVIRPDASIIWQVSAQSPLTGVFYLYAAVVSWTVFAESRDKFIAQENAKAIGDKLADGHRHITIQLF
ncbi:hypothetical protein ACHAW5_002748 [Stephanodiscus triporus]|uniref:Uncharacterized protein n=1 Tax=Stephanodiscus triporus TaxID=2934178 RepID=A0ABD3NLV9_9STRA